MELLRSLEVAIAPLGGTFSYELTTLPEVAYGSLEVANVREVALLPPLLGSLKPLF